MGRGGPDAARASSRARARPAGGLDRLLQRARAALASAWNRLRDRGPASFLAWLGRDGRVAGAAAAREPLAWLLVVLLALAPWLVRLWRARRRRRREAARDAIPAIPPDLRALLRELERRWARCGASPPRRPRAARARARARGGPGAGTPVPAALVAAAQEVVGVYYRARFGGEAPDPAETTRLRQALRP